MSLSFGFMKYNIDFELFGSIIIAIILIFFKLKYAGNTESEKSFVKLAYTVLIAQFMDMATAVTISIGGPKMVIFNLLFTTLYFIVGLYSCLNFVEYILVFAYKKKVKKFSVILNVIGALNTVSLIINIFFGYYFYFDKVTGDYVHSSFYYILFVLPTVMTMNSLILIVYHRKHFDKRQFISILSFVFFTVLGLMLQSFVIPDVYITYGLVTISFLMIVFPLRHLITRSL